MMEYKAIKSQDTKSPHYWQIMRDRVLAYLEGKTYKVSPESEKGQAVGFCKVTISFENGQSFSPRIESELTNFFNFKSKCYDETKTQFRN